MSKTVQTQSGVKKGSTKKGNKKATAPKVETPRIVSKRYTEMEQKVKDFDKKNAGSWDKLGQVSRKVTLDALGLNKALKNYLRIAKGELTSSQMKVLTFKNCQQYIKSSIKNKNLHLFTTNDIKLICQKVLVKYDANTKRGERVSKQGGTVGKKADAQTRRGANTK